MRITRLLSVLFFCLVGQTCLSAQIRVERLSLIDTSRAELYIGFPNRIRFVGLLASDEVFLGNEAITDRNGDVVIFRVQKSAQTIDTVKLLRNGTLLLAQQYHVLRHPDPKLFLGDVSLNDAKAITRNSLIAAEKLHFECGNLRDAVTVDSFELSVVKRGEYSVLGLNASAAFTSLQSQQLGMLELGDRIYIDNIRGTFIADNRRRQIMSVSLIVPK